MFREGNQAGEQQRLESMAVVTENMERIEGASATPRSQPHGTSMEFVSRTPPSESGRMEPPADEASGAETRMAAEERLLCVVDTSEAGKSRKTRLKTGGRMRMSKGITVDSGAADNVMPRKMLRKGNEVRPSQASKAGVYYVAADNGRIANEGEVDFPFETRDGTKHRWTFQVANVNKVLAAVSAMVDSVHRVFFEKDMATGTDVSMIIHKATGKIIKMKRDRNV